MWIKFGLNLVRISDIEDVASKNNVIVIKANNKLIGEDHTSLESVHARLYELAKLLNDNLYSNYPSSFEIKENVD